MPSSFASGRIVSIPCEIAPGMASNEREIKVNVPEGIIRAFVSLASVGEDPKPNSNEKRDGRVRAVIIALSNDDIRLFFAGQDVDPANPAPVPSQWLKQNARIEASNHRP